RSREDEELEDAWADVKVERARVASVLTATLDRHTVLDVSVAQTLMQKVLSRAFEEVRPSHDAAPLSMKANVSGPKVVGSSQAMNSTSMTSPRSGNNQPDHILANAVSLHKLKSTPWNTVGFVPRQALLYCHITTEVGNFTVPAGWNWKSMSPGFL